MTYIHVPHIIGPLPHNFLSSLTHSWNEPFSKSGTRALLMYSHVILVLLALQVREHEIFLERVRHCYLSNNLPKKTSVHKNQDPLRCTFIRYLRASFCRHGAWQLHDSRLHSFGSCTQMTHDESCAPIPIPALNLLNSTCRHPHSRAWFASWTWDYHPVKAHEPWAPYICFDGSGSAGM
jgi:hypothetical protein